MVLFLSSSVRAQEIGQIMTLKGIVSLSMVDPGDDGIGPFLEVVLDDTSYAPIHLTGQYFFESARSIYTNAYVGRIVTVTGEFYYDQSVPVLNVHSVDAVE